ncbi:MAG: beta-lactamase family protein [Methanobrevibacter sp.]|nr:beta-lactamase family protein [Methanobrevibacter sp.]
MLNSKNNHLKREIEEVFNGISRQKKIHEAILFVESSNDDFSVSFGYGGKDIRSPFFIASVTKLFITACILILLEEKKLSFDNFIINYFDKTTLEGLHNYKGEEYSNRLTISDLLFHRSGLADGLEEGGFLKQLLKDDFELSFEEVLTKTKELSSHFPLNTPKKAYYSDVNFSLLSKIIEKITGETLSNVYKKYICVPLGLTNTYLPSSSNDFIPKIYYKNESLHRPKFLTSSYNYDLVSTAEDLMKFLKAFFNGSLFSSSIFEDLAIYRKLQMSMGPIHYGGGYMQIPMKSIYTLFRGKGELIGHSGTTGSFAFYYPHKDLYFVGDLNQMADPGLPIKLAMKLSMKLK